MKPTRRTFLESIGLTTAVTLAGCQEMLSGSGQPEEQDETKPTPQETASPTPTPREETPTPEEKQTPEETPEPTPTAEFKESGTFVVEARDGILGPQGYYDQGEILENQPDDHLPLTVHVSKNNPKPTNPLGPNPQEETQIHHLSTQEFKERYLFKNSIELSRTSGRLKENKKQAFQQLPYQINNPHYWRKEIYPELKKEWGVEELKIDSPEEKLDFEKMENADNLKEFFINSNLDEEWNLIEYALLEGGPGSGQNFIKAGLLADSAYHQAEIEAYTFPQTTVGGGHGLAWGLVELGWNDPTNQQAWGIETDTSRDKQIWKVDEYEESPNRLDNESPAPPYSNQDWGAYAWQTISRNSQRYKNLRIAKAENGEQFGEFFENPETEPGMPYPISSAILNYLNDQTRPRPDEQDVMNIEPLHQGTHQELHNSTINMHPDKIEYEKAV